ncbi:glycosyltransferase family 4 protein [bacterium]|nr:glycosyltransferase family 4 protein [bacterium]
MNILLITDLYPVKETEKYTPKTLLNFVKSWEELGHNVTVIKPNFLINSFIRKKPFYKEGKYGNVINLNYITPFFNVKKAEKYCKIDDFDIIIAHMPVGILFADRLRKDFVAGCHVSDIQVLTSPLYKFYFRHALKKAYQNSKCIACRSEQLKNKFLKLFPDMENKVFTAPSGVNKEIIVMKIIKNKPVKILTAAHLIKRKNIDKVILAVNEFPEMVLTIVGSGEELPKLKKLAGENVVFKGQLPHDEVLKEMRNSDIFILPSVNETLGMVYLEALASGCITVGVKNDGADGIIKDGENGFLLNSPTVDEIKHVIKKIIEYIYPQKITDNAYNQMLNYTDTACAENYLQQILKFFDKNAKI